MTVASTADLLRRRRRLDGRGMGGLDARKHRARPAVPLDQNRKPDGGKHENNCRPCRHLGQQVGCSAGTERGLRTLAAKGSGEISALALLEKHYPNQDEANNNVNRTDQPDHGEPQSNGAEGGT
jgi:hypothetical protein